MARGWESKSVEQQQEERALGQKGAGPELSREQKERDRKMHGLKLSRQRMAQELIAAQNPRHRRMLEEGIAELDRQLSSFESVTPDAPKGSSGNA